MPSKRLKDTLARLAKPRQANRDTRDIRDGGTVEVSIDNAMLMQRRDWMRLKERGAKRIIVKR